MNQSFSEKLFRILPGLNLIHTYKKEYVLKDIFAGVSVAAIVLPIGIAYAGLLGLPPETGLYSSILPMVAYALLGSSRQLILGPDSATCLLVASVITPLAANNFDHYQSLSVLVAFLVGIMCILGGAFRLGMIANFLSKPILTGYLNGLAVSIIVGQLGKFFGFDLSSREFFDMVYEFSSKIAQTNIYTISIGGGALLILMLLKKFYPRLPAPLITVIIGIIVMIIFGDKHSVTLVGHIPSGFPSFRLPDISNVNLLKLSYESSGIVLISYCSLMLTNKSFASRNGYSIKPNQDFIALGVADVMSGLSQGFVISGADSRTAVNNASGGKTQLVSVYAAIAILICLMFFTGYLSLLPVTVLSAIIIMACIGLFDIEYSKKLFKLSRVEFTISIITSLSVLIIGVMPGVLIAVVLSVFRLINAASHPRVSIQGKLKGSAIYQNVEDNNDVVLIPGILILKVESAMIFFKSDYIKDRITKIISSQKEKVECVILNVVSVNLIDVTAAGTFENLSNELTKEGTIILIARANTQVVNMISEVNALDKNSKENNFNSVREAVQYFQDSKKS